MRSDEFLELVNKKISSFCLDVCGCLCCKKGSLVIEEDKIKEFKLASLKDVIIEQKFSRFFLSLKDGCPCLENNSCKVYGSFVRPLVCARFPLLFLRKQVIIASWCPAVSSGFLDEEISFLEKEGYTINR